jgi:hypothetical protein
MHDEGQTFRKGDLRKMQDREEKRRYQGAVRESEAQAEAGITCACADLHAKVADYQVLNIIWIKESVYGENSRG